MDKDIEQPKVLNVIPSHLGATNMAHSTAAITTGYHQATLTPKDIIRLNKENSILILPEEYGYVLQGTPIIGKFVLDEKGAIKTDKDGKPIQALYTICVVKRNDGVISAGRVTLSWLAGEDLVTDNVCPLAWCNDGVRKYAATYKCTPAVTRDFSLNLQVGDKKFPYTLCVKGGQAIEAFRLPSFDEVWTKIEGSNVYKNVDGLADKESIELHKVTRSTLTTAEYNLTDDEYKVAQKKVELALQMLRVDFK